MLRIIFEQVVKRLFPRRSMQSLTKSEILRAENEAIQIMNRTKGKTGEVIDLTGRRIDTSQPIIGGKNVANDVDGIINNLKSMEPMDAMKEANLIIGRKGKYKNLSGDEAQRILKDTDDHIFQRDIKYDEFGDPIKPDPEDFASGGIAGQLHLNRPGYQQGNEVLPPSLRGKKTEDDKIPYLFKKIMSYDKDVMPEEYKIPGSGGYGSILRHVGNTALLKKQLSEKMKPYTGKGIADFLGGTLAFGGGTLHELTAGSPIFTDEKRMVDEALPFDVGPSKKLSTEFKEDMLANLYGALYGKTGIKDKEVLDRLIEKLSKQDNWSKIFSELIAEQAHEDPERPMRIMPRMISKKVKNPETGKIEKAMIMVDSPFSNKKLTQKEFIEEMEDKGKLATSATEGSFAEGGRAGFANGLPAIDPRMYNTYAENKAANEAQRQANQSARQKVFNVFMTPKETVAKDQGIVQLARDTGKAPQIQNYAINSGTDISRMIGPGTGISSGTGDYGGTTYSNLGFAALPPATRKSQTTAPKTTVSQTTTAPDLSKQSEAFGKMIMQKLEEAYGKPEDYRAEAATLNMPVAAYMDYLMTRDEKGIHDKYMHLDPYYYQYKDDLVSEDPSNRPPSPLEAYYQKELQRQIDQGIPEAERIQKGQVLGSPGMIPTSGTMLSAYGYVPYEDALARTKTEMGLAKGGLANILGV